MSELPQEDGWHRLHPLTPVIKGWTLVVGFLAVLASGGLDDVLRAELPLARRLLLFAGSLGAVVAVVSCYALAVWWRSHYRLEVDGLRLQTGVLSRQDRQARLDRLQAVDVVRPLLARFVGLAALQLEVAGGKDSAITLSFLREDDAQQLRATLLARAAGLKYEGVQPPEAPEREIFVLPVGRMVESIVRGPLAISVVGGIGGTIAISVVLREPGVIVAFIPLSALVMNALWVPFNRGFGFRLAVSPDGVRLRHGLMTTRSQTVPPGRVQAVRLTQPWWWRGRDWWRVNVTVAGYGGGSHESGAIDGQDDVLHPVATRAEALRAVSLVVPGMEVVSAGLTSRDSGGGFLPSPRSARWLDPVGWRRRGLLITAEVLVIRRGWLWRQVDVVPHARSQSAAVGQGPVQRRLGVATFQVHATPGPVSPIAKHVPIGEVAWLMAEQGARARAARTAAADRDQGQWLPSQ
ncbi:MAG: PH domain-containing protein [Actinomycetota bacterium]